MRSPQVPARWRAFLPYAVIGTVHLVGLLVGATAVSGPTKGLLMPALLLALLVALPARRGSVALYAGVGVLFAWAGDLLLSSPGDNGFVLGLGAFMLTHVAYLVLFLRPLRVRRIPVATVVLALWWAALLLILAPFLGVLLVPVAAYGLVLGGSTAASFGTVERRIGLIPVGAILFLLSDTLLAFKLFWPDFSVWQADFLIMLGYILGQGLIVLGTVQHRRAAA